MTREFTPHEIKAMNLAADVEDGVCDGEPDYALTLLMYRHYYGFGTEPISPEAINGFRDLIAIVRAYDGARRET